MPSIRPAPLLAHLGLWLGLVGCAATVHENPVSFMLNRQADPDQRLAAARQAAARPAEASAYQAALEQWLFDLRQPTSLRRYAIDELLRLDEAGFRQKVAQRIVLIENWETLNYLLQMAQDRQWTDFTPAIVRSYARKAHGVTDDDRPERKALETLNPGKTVEQIVFEVFANAQRQAGIEQQTGAWELLCRISSPQALMNALETAPPATPLVADLQACARDLATLPVNREGVLWLMHLRDPARQAFWNQARERVARLSPEQRRGLQLRHLPILLAMDQTLLALDRAQLLAKVNRLVESRGEHYLKGPTYDGAAADWPQTLREAEPKLAWADLATIWVLQSLLSNPTLTAQLFTQADADQQDSSTEYGGLIQTDNAGSASASLPQAVMYKPTLRKHDLTFIPTPQMIERLYTSLAHYHFHAQQKDNALYAGPGAGDLKLADRLNPNCLVFTFIDANRMNVDYYQPGGTVVDLGVIARP